MAVSVVVMVVVVVVAAVAAAVALPAAVLAAVAENYRETSLSGAREALHSRNPLHDCPGRGSGGGDPAIWQPHGKTRVRGSETAKTVG